MKLYVAGPFSGSSQQSGSPFRLSSWSGAASSELLQVQRLVVEKSLATGDGVVDRSRAPVERRRDLADAGRRGPRDSPVMVERAFGCHQPSRVIAPVADYPEEVFDHPGWDADPGAQAAKVMSGIGVVAQRWRLRPARPAASRPRHAC